MLIGREGVDRLDGGAGDDYLAAGDGNDYRQDWIGGPAPGGLHGGAGNDTLVGGGGYDTIYGEDGDDIFLVDEDGGSHFDYHHGGAGSDTVSFERFSAGVWFWLADNRQGDYSAICYNDGFLSIENATGSRHNDELQGDNDINLLRGLAGNERMAEVLSFRPRPMRSPGVSSGDGLKLAA